MKAFFFVLALAANRTQAMIKCSLAAFPVPRRVVCAPVNRIGYDTGARALR